MEGCAVSTEKPLTNASPYGNGICRGRGELENELLNDSNFDKTNTSQMSARAATGSGNVCRFRICCNENSANYAQQKKIKAELKVLASEIKSMRIGEYVLLKKMPLCCSRKERKSICQKLDAVRKELATKLDKFNQFCDGFKIAGGSIVKDGQPRIRIIQLNDRLCEQLELMKKMFNAAQKILHGSESKVLIGQIKALMKRTVAAIGEMKNVGNGDDEAALTLALEMAHMEAKEEFERSGKKSAQKICIIALPSDLQVTIQLHIEKTVFGSRTRVVLSSAGKKSAFVFNGGESIEKEIHKFCQKIAFNGACAGYSIQLGSAVAENSAAGETSNGSSMQSVNFEQPMATAQIVASGQSPVVGAAAILSTKISELILKASGSCIDMARENIGPVTIDVNVSSVQSAIVTIRINSSGLEDQDAELCNGVSFTISLPNTSTAAVDAQIHAYLAICDAQLLADTTDQLSKASAHLIMEQQFEDAPYSAMTVEIFGNEFELLCADGYLVIRHLNNDDSIQLPIAVSNDSVVSDGSEVDINCCKAVRDSIGMFVFMHAHKLQLFSDRAKETHETSDGTPTNCTGTIFGEMRHASQLDDLCDSFFGKGAEGSSVAGETPQNSKKTLNEYENAVGDSDSTVDKKSQPSDDAFDLLLAIANKESETMQGGAQYKIKAANLIITVTSNPNYLVLSYGNSSFKISKNIITFSGNLPLYVLDVITTVFRGESLINSKLLQSVLEEQNYFINKFGKYVDRGKRDESISEKSFASLQKHFYNTLNLCLICGDENLCTQTLGLMLSVLGKIVDESVSFRDSAMMQMALAKMTRTLLECFPNFPKLADLTEREMENFNALCSIADFSLGARPSNATAD